MGYFDGIARQSAQDEQARVVHNGGTAHPYALAALRGEVQRVAEAANGTRNDTLNRAWFAMGRHIAAETITVQTVRDQLAAAARATGLPQTEIDTVLRLDSTSALVAAEGLARTPTDMPDAPGVTILDGEVIGPPLNPLIDWHELFATDDDGEEWIIEPLLPARRMIALYSPPKAGKSLLVLEVAVGISRGVTVLGATPDRAHRVLYVDFENDPRGDVRTRLEAMDVTPDQLGNLCYLTFPSLAKFDTQQGALDLLRHVEAYHCDVVIIDTVSRSVMGEENENDTWLNFYRHTGLALKRAGVACIRLDHSGKDLDKGMRGGSAKYGDVDAVWRLTALGEDTIRLECTDNRMPVPTKTMVVTRQEYPLSHIVANDAYQAGMDARAKSADALLDSLGISTSASVREAGKALREAGHKVENRALRDAVRVRKLRLDMPSQGVPGTPAAHLRHTAHGVEGVPGTPTHPPKGDGVCGTPRDGTTGVPEADDDLVGCKRCFKPTTRGVASRNDGLCANCLRQTGQLREA